MGLYKNKFRTETTRLREWDYSTPSWYYVTVCTKNMECWFGKVKGNEMILNSIGKMVDKFWTDIPAHYPNIEPDYYVIMPNHLHGIVIFNDAVETGHAPSLRIKTTTLGNVIGSFKSAVSKWCRQNNKDYFHWQPRFYDHIIRNEKDLHRIRTYIHNNPIKWELDKYYNL